MKGDDAYWQSGPAFLNKIIKLYLDTVVGYLKQIPLKQQSYRYVMPL